MPADWTTFLRSEGARMEGECVLDFGQPEREAELALTSGTITVLSCLTVLSQFTSDVQQLAEGNSQPGAWCNPKGQVIANFILARRDAGYYLLLPRELKDIFIKRLQMFVLRARVTIEDCSESWQCLGINNAGAGELPTVSGSQLLVPVPVNRPRGVLAGPAAVLRESWPQLARSYTGIGSHYWQLFDVLDGQPWILEATTETFLPQLLNMDQTQAVSFSKGCFPGQEVIARLQHRGKVKQRLFIARLAPDTAMAPGTKIYNKDRDQSIGALINSASHPTDGAYALAVLDIDYGAPEQLYIKNNPAGFIDITTPPYLILP